MERAPQRGDRAAPTRDDAILGEAGRRVLGRRAEGDVDALAQIAVHVATIALPVRDDLDRALALELAALALRLQHAREIVGAAREERQAAALRLEAGGIGHRRHLDRPTWCRRRSC